MTASRHGQRFNHDSDAASYDRSVSHEAHPIRAGYAECLRWVAERANAAPPGWVADLGVGTGNLAALLAPTREVVAVDLSHNMIEIARMKLESRPVEFVVDDILGFIETDARPLAAVMSTYALHHLEPDEKDRIIRLIGERLIPGGLFVMGDLAFRDAGDGRATVDALVKDGHADVADDVKDEFFWDLSLRRPAVEAWAEQIEQRRFSHLSWGLVARKRA